MTIFEIDAKLQDLMETAQEEEQSRGAVTAETEAEIRRYFEAAREKVDGIGGYVLSETSRVRMLKDEAARLYEHAKTAENRILRTKSMIQWFLTERGLPRIQGVRCTLSLQNNSQAGLAVSDPAAVPDRFFRAVVHLPVDQVDDVRQQFDVIEDAKVLDTEALRAALTAGEEVPGAKLERGKHVRVR